MRSSTSFVETGIAQPFEPVSPQARTFGQYLARKYFDSREGLARQDNSGLYVELTEDHLAELLGGACEVGMSARRRR